MQNLMEYEDLPDKEDLARETEPDVDRVPEQAPRGRPPAGLGARARLLGVGAFLLLAGALAYGGWNYLAHYRAVMATAQQSRDFVPSVQVGEVRMNDSKLSVTLPGTTAAFSAANIYARASGYIEKRDVDIGDHVKAGQLLAQITAPELDHQISQAEATLGQSQATLLQTQANTELAHVTNDRNSPLVKQGWVTTQQGDTDALDPEGAGGRHRRGAGQHRGVAGETSSAAAAKGLSAGRRPVRRRRDPTQRRRRQPGAGRRGERHLHVRRDAKRRDPHLRLCAAGRGVRAQRLASRPSSVSRKFRAGRFRAK